MSRRSLVLLVMLASACSVGPDYRRPEVVVPTAYKELGEWKTAEPSDDLARGPWWERYGDAELSRLEQQVTEANQDLAAAEARFRQAKALVSNARADWWPTVTIGVAATRARQSARLNTSFASGSVDNNYAMPLEASWELDLWGRIRRNVESSEASAQATAADLESSRASRCRPRSRRTTSSSAPSTDSRSSSTRPWTPSPARST
jgi:outer membrane protein TolC